MVTVHAFLALFAGFVAIAAGMLIATAVLRHWVPEWSGQPRHPQPGYVFANFGCAFLAAGAGGYVTAWAAGRQPFPAMLGLGVVVLALGAISALQARGTQPAWYQVGLIAIAPLGVVVGGLVRLRILGVL